MLRQNDILRILNHFGSEGISVKDIYDRLKKKNCDIKSITEIKSILRLGVKDGISIYHQSLYFPKRKATLERIYSDQSSTEDSIWSSSPTVERRECRWPSRVQTFHNRQSPVDVVTTKAVRVNLPDLTVGSLTAETPGLITNNGHSVFITTEGVRPRLAGGPLGEAQFLFEQCNFHWGSADYWGSEHFLDGNSFALEAQLVYFNSKYANFAEAASRDDGLVVLAVFAKVTARANRLVAPLLKTLPSVAKAMDQLEVTNIGSVLQWVASGVSVNQEYYSYPGSLTTTPFSGNVTYVVLPTPIKLSASQLQAFRMLEDVDNEPITNNSQPIQPLYKRPIVRSGNIIFED